MIIIIIVIIIIITMIHVVYTNKYSHTTTNNDNEMDPESGGRANLTPTALGIIRQTYDTSTDTYNK